VRTRIGPVTGPSLRPGAWRALTSGEVLALYAASAGAAGAGAGRTARRGGQKKGGPSRADRGDR